MGTQRRIEFKQTRGTCPKAQNERFNIGRLYMVCQTVVNHGSDRLSSLRVLLCIIPVGLYLGCYVF
jgi:hypothetical protein